MSMVAERRMAMPRDGHFCAHQRLAEAEQSGKEADKRETAFDSDAQSE